MICNPHQIEFGCHIKMDEMEQSSGKNGERNIEGLVWKSEGTTWNAYAQMANSIKMYVRVVGWDGVSWILLHLARNKLRAPANTVMNIRVPYNAGEFLD